MISSANPGAFALRRHQRQPLALLSAIVLAAATLSGCSKDSDDPASLALRAAADPVPASARGKPRQDSTKPSLVTADPDARVKPDPSALAVIRLAARSDQIAQVRAGNAVRNDFRLTGTSGDLVSLDAFRGRPLVIIFGSSDCAQACGRIARHLSDAIGRRGLSSLGYQLVLVSARGDHDTPAVLGSFVESIGASGLKMTGLTGAPGDVAMLAGRFDNPLGSEPTLIHLVDASGIWRQSMSAASSVDQFADALAAIGGSGGQLASGPKN